MKGRVLDRLVAAERDHRSVALATDLKTGRQLLLDGDDLDGDLALDDADLDRVRETWRSGRNRSLETTGGRCVRRGADAAASLLHRRRRPYRPAAGADAGDDRLRGDDHRSAQILRDRGALSRHRDDLRVARRGARTAEAGPRLGGRDPDPRSRSSTTRHWPRRCVRTASTSARSARAATTPGAVRGSRNWALATLTSPAFTGRSGCRSARYRRPRSRSRSSPQMTQILRRGEKAEAA